MTGSDPQNRQNNRKRSQKYEGKEKSQSCSLTSLNCNILSGLDPNRELSQPKQCTTSAISEMRNIHFAGLIHPVLHFFVRFP